DQIGTGAEMADNVITVGALDPEYGSEMLASFSNYGKSNVDIFAPGGKVYSTMPNNEYDFNGGTSMASPGVAGIAALLRSQFPKLSAAQVKKIILKSGLPIKATMILGGNPDKSGKLEEVSTSGRIANAYNALIVAAGVSKGKINL
ncbi:MAG: S8 family serine peptidase, partial [Bacteroidota bacterium]